MNDLNAIYHQKKKTTKKTNKQKKNRKKLVYCYGKASLLYLPILHEDALLR